MPRVKQTNRQQHALAHERVTAYIEQHFGSMRAASEALGLVHTRIWRATQRNQYGPSIAVCEALADHSGRPVDYFRGRCD